MSKKGLGKGLGALLDMSQSDIGTDDNNKISELKITDVEPNRQQPRKKFDEEKLNALADSIAKHGVIQPIIVTKSNDRYIITAGERRWRAAKKAGLSTIPAIIREYSDKISYQIALIENLQREDLNPIEEAMGIKQLMDEFSMTQEEISEKIGRSRSSIANTTRLLNASEDVRQALIDGTITSGHARAVMSVTSPEGQTALLNSIIENDLNVRQSEAMAKRISAEKPKKAFAPLSAYDIEIDRIQNKISSSLGTKVTISHSGKKGKIQIEYYSDEDLERLMEIFGI
ncbi:MAG: ParB/RepB/Spo0J family partition protein [Oscillospiraceae bacterium]|nr:ParB/RepB/Spo0J family partition protein [Oscillospiraceae bacterium]